MSPPVSPDSESQEGSAGEQMPAASTRQSDQAVNAGSNLRDSLREVWTIAWPTVLTMTSYTVMQFIDKVMVAQIGPIHLTAQSNGGIWAFSAFSFIMGVLTVINTYVSQNFGAGTPQNGPKYAWAGFWLAVGVWLFFLLPYAACLPWLFESLGHSPELQKLETGYSQILLAGGIMLLVSRGISHYFFGMHMPKVITVAAIVGNIVNVIGNYALIYGSAGITITVGERIIQLPGVPYMPALGVYGAAIATVFGTFIELLIPTCIFLGPKLNKKFNTRKAWRPNWKTSRDLLRIGWPAGVQWANEIVCWAIFMTVLVGSFGENHMTAGWIALSYMHLSFMPALGCSVAVTSLVGKYIGAGKPDIAASRAHLGLWLTVGYMTFCGLIMLVFRYELVGIFLLGQDIPAEDASEIIRWGGYLMICAAVFQTFDAFGIVYTGALRGAGDTVWPGIITIIYSWLFIVACGWLLVKLTPQLASIGPWIAASVYIIAYGLTMWARFARGRWRSIRLLSDSDSATKYAAGEASPVLPGAPATRPDTAVRDIAEPISESMR